MDFSVFYGSENLGLSIRAHVANLVKENSPSLGKLQLPLAGGMGSRERSLFVAKQFTL